MTPDPALVGGLATRIWRILSQVSRKGGKGGGKKETKGGVCNALQLILSNIPVKQSETTTKRQAERAEAFIAPAEDAAPTVEEKQHRKRTVLESELDREGPEGNEKRKKKKKQKLTDKP